MCCCLHPCDLSLWGYSPQMDSRKIYVMVTEVFRLVDQDKLSEQNILSYKCNGLNFSEHVGKSNLKTSVTSSGKYAAQRSTIQTAPSTVNCSWQSDSLAPLALIGRRKKHLSVGTLDVVIRLVTNPREVLTLLHI